MKIAVIAPTSMPSRRANTIQVMKMTQAFGSIGHEARLAIPGGAYRRAGDAEWRDLARHYGLSRKFSVEWLPSGERLRRYDFAVRAVRWARSWGAGMVFTRLPQAAALASLSGRPVILEAHDYPGGKFGPLVFKVFLRGSGACRLVAISQALLVDLKETFHMNPTPGFDLVAPDGVDLDRFTDLPEPKTARAILIERYESFDDRITSFLSPDRFTAGYTGHLYPGRGVEILFQLAACAPEIAFLIAGGEPQALSRLTAEAEERGLRNLVLMGFVPNAEVPLVQAACEVLLMPYQRHVAASSGGDIARYLSPMKLFEYMASKRAILSSDLPVLREVLSEENAVLLPPDDTDAWVTALRKLRDDPERRASLIGHAWGDVQKYSWETRAEAILVGLEKTVTA